MSTIAALKIWMSADVSDLDAANKKATGGLSKVDFAATKNLKTLEAQSRAYEMVGRATSDSADKQAKAAIIAEALRLKQQGVSDEIIRQTIKQREYLQSLQATERASVSFSDRVSSAAANAAKGFAVLGLAIQGVKSIVSGVQSTVGAPLKLAAEAEQTHVAFTVLLKSGERAEKMMKRLTRFAADTPFAFPEITSAAKKLVAFGIAADDVVPTLTRLGNVGAALGIPLGELSEIYGKARVQGRLFGEDMNQIAGRGIPIQEALAKQLGKTTEQIKKMVSDGEINFGHLEQAFKDLADGSGDFAGLMEAQSKTLSGVFANMQDNIEIVMTDIGAAIAKSFNLSGVMNSVSEFADSFRDRYLPALKSVFDITAMVVKKFSEWSIILKLTVPVIAGVVGVMGAIVLAQKAIAAGQALVLALSGPKGWAILAAGAAIGYASVAGVAYAMDGLAESAKTAAAEAEKTGKSVEKLGNSAASAAGKWVDLKKEIQEPLRAEADKLLNPAEDLRKQIQDLYQASFGPEDKQTFQVLYEARVDKATGVYTELRKLQDEVDVLTGKTTEAEIKFAEMLRKGAPEDVVEKLRELEYTKQRIEEGKKLTKQLEDERKAKYNSNLEKAKAVLERIKTPLEKFKSEMAELHRLKELNFINPDQFARAAALLRKDLQNELGQAKPLQLASAAEFGSAEARSAIIRHRFGSGNDPMRNLEKTNAKQLTEQQKSNTHLSVIATRTAKIVQLPA